MELDDALEVAVGLMVEHGLGHWRFQFDDAQVRFGQCQYSKQTVSVSRVLTLLNSREEFIDTVLHEIAHALRGWSKESHDWRWVAWARTVGARPVACYGEDVVKPEPKWLLFCPLCEEIVGDRMARDKASVGRMACGPCCRKAGRWLRAAVLVWVENPDYSPGGVVAARTKKS